MSTDLTKLFGRVFPVPVYNQIFTLGSKVSWIVEPKRRNGPPSFNASGRIVKLYTTTFGGRLKKQAAKIEVSDDYLKMFPNRRFTTVSVDKLKHLM